MVGNAYRPIAFGFKGYSFAGSDTGAAHAVMFDSPVPTQRSMVPSRLSGYGLYLHADHPHYQFAEPLPDSQQPKATGPLQSSDLTPIPVAGG